MIGDHLYETETMAELCVRQGRVGEAIAIYRRLADGTGEPEVCARWRRRASMLETTWQPLRQVEVPPADIALPPAPGVVVHVADDQVTIAWALPDDMPSPALELMLIQRTPAGIETSKKTLPLDRRAGRLGLAAPALYSVLAAVGAISEGRFVPAARTRSS